MLNDAEKTKLINLFGLEILSMKSSSDLSEQRLNYMADMLFALSKIADPRSIPLLLEPFVLTSGGVATTALASDGQAAIAPTISALRKYQRPLTSSETVYALSLVMALDRMLLLKPAMSEANRLDIRAHLMHESYSSERHLREAALRGLITIGDDVSRNRISELSRTDPWSTKISTVAAFPIREEASKALMGAAH